MGEEIRKEKEVAKIEKADVGFEDHGLFTAFVTFNYGDSGQGIGYIIDLDFIKRFIRACGVDTLSECVGRVVQVTHSHANIHRIEPMAFEDGEAFDVDAWANRVKSRSTKKRKK